MARTTQPTPNAEESQATAGVSAAPPAGASPPESAPEAESGAEGEEAGDEEVEIRPSGWRSVLRGSAACLASMVVHVIGLVVLGLLAFPTETTQVLEEIVSLPFDRPKEDELEEVQLDPDLVPATEFTTAAASASAVAGALSGGEGAMGVPGGLSGEVAISTEVSQQFSAPQAGPGDFPLEGLPTGKRLIAEAPDGVKGDSRLIARDYDHAFDIITQEIMWMLDRGDVLVVWCFDESESMKDDMREVRDRISKVYQELGLAGVSRSEHLQSAVTSYGKDFHIHTPKPSGNAADIQQVISSIAAAPPDASGLEHMCAAVTKSIIAFRNQVKNRQVALVLVTDESGEQEDNVGLLEDAIAQAQSVKCKIYTLGREAVFGYPYAYFRWQDPATKRTHWLRVNRGPETSFVEQLQTNGFHRRHDAFGSGFGPYEQTRMSRETNGIFFMLPTTEANIVRGERRKYELDILRPYAPDLRSRLEVRTDLEDAKRYPLRPFIRKVINETDPWNPQASMSIEMRLEYAIDLPTFVRQAEQERNKAVRFIQNLGEVQRIIEQAQQHRAQEPAPRWQANFDLIYAQVVAYQARLYEYGAAVEEFVRNPQTAPPTKLVGKDALILVHWDVHTRKELLAADASQPYIDKASDLFKVVIENHPDTPWAERAKEELQRGFGVHFVPDYDYPIPSGVSPTPLPKY